MILFHSSLIISLLTLDAWPTCYSLFKVHSPVGRRRLPLTPVRGQKHQAQANNSAILFSRHKATRLPAGSHCDLCGKAFLTLFFHFAFCQLHSPSTNSGGDDGTRTRGIRLAKAALSQLSYIPVLAALLIFPVRVLVGLSGLEPETSPLSEARSNQLS